MDTTKLRVSDSRQAGSVFSCRFSLKTAASHVGEEGGPGSSPLASTSVVSDAVSHVYFDPELACSAHSFEQ